jgi:GNAT superfamily N-acetyltransferase
MDVIEIEDPSGAKLLAFVGTPKDIADQVSSYDDFQELARWLPKNETGTIGYIFSVEVPERLRRTGKGRGIMEDALAQMKKTGARTAYVHAAPWTGGDRFASRLGFAPVDCCEGDGGFVVMSIDL